MAEITSLSEAVRDLIRDGDTVAFEGFTHLIPSAAALEAMRQGKRDLTLIRMTPDIIYDQFIGLGLTRGLVFAWGGNPGVGSLHRLRDAVENGWPKPIELDERSHSDMANAYAAGASGLPFAVFRGHLGDDLPKVNSRLKRVTCPFTGEVLAAVPATRPDVGVVHAQRADKRGNVLLWGIIGIQKEVVLASKRTIVSVEEIVDDLQAPPNACVLPHFAVGAVCLEPHGAWPSYAQGFYKRDNGFYKAWDNIAREREAFLAWMKRHVLATKNFAEYEASLKSAAKEVARA
jgi:glutaconate CoA-transferase, subunit A